MDEEFQKIAIKRKDIEKTDNSGNISYETHSRMLRVIAALGAIFAASVLSKKN